MLPAVVLEVLNTSRSLDGYQVALERAWHSQPPPYDEPWFIHLHHQLARDPSWFASLLASNVDMEGYSSRQLWAYATALGSDEFGAALRRHALDEARHSRVFAYLLFLLFPRLKSAELVEKFSAMSPRHKRQDVVSVPADKPRRPPEEVLNSAVLISLHEIKALILEQMLRPVLLAYATAETRSKVERAMDAIIRDEMAHIQYSAAYVDRLIKRGFRDCAFDSILDFQRLINVVTEQDVESRYGFMVEALDHASVPSRNEEVTGSEASCIN